VDEEARRIPMEASLQCFATLVEDEVCNHKSGVQHEITKGEKIKCLLTRVGIPHDEVQAVFLNGRTVNLDAALHHKDRVTLMPFVGPG
jgi:sulfur carrier protein ThiS